MSLIKKLKAYAPVLGGIKPDYNLKNIFEINIDELYEKGIRGIFFDLDSTICVSKSAQFTDKTRKFISDCEAKGLKLAVISNNYSKKYIDKVQAEIHLKIYYPAEKPQTDVILKAMEELGLSPLNTAMVGDRPVTDILAGQNVGMMTILVDGIEAENENLPTRFIRFVERLTVIK